MHSPFVCFEFVLIGETFCTALKWAAKFLHLMPMIDMIVHLLAIGRIKVAANMWTLEVTLIVHYPQMHIEQFVFAENVRTLGTGPVDHTTVIVFDVFAE